MGAMQNNARGNGKASKARGTTKNSDRLDAFSKGNSKGSAEWGTCDPQRLLAVVVGITSLGGAITFGLSKDEGAHSLTLMLGGNRKTLWFNGDADLDVELEGVADTLEGMAT